MCLPEIACALHAVLGALQDVKVYRKPGCKMCYRYPVVSSHHVTYMNSGIRRARVSAAICICTIHVLSSRKDNSYLRPRVGVLYHHTTTQFCSCRFGL